MDPSAIGLLPLVLIVTTIAVGAFIKGITGLGLPIFAIPTLAMFVPIDHAVVIMVLPSVIANSWLILVHREHLPVLKEHRTFIILGVAGAFTGTWILASANDTILRSLLAFWLGIYLLQHFLNKDTPRTISAGNLTAGPLGFAAGTLQGATGISAPIIAPYYHARNLTTSMYAFAVASSFMLLSVSQLVGLTTANLITPTLAGYGVLATITTMVFIPVGVRYSHKLSQRTFGRILITVFVLIEVKLIYDVLSLIGWL